MLNTFFVGLGFIRVKKKNCTYNVKHFFLSCLMFFFFYIKVCVMFHLYFLACDSECGEAVGVFLLGSVLKGHVFVSVFMIQQRMSQVLSLVFGYQLLKCAITLTGLTEQLVYDACVNF